MSEYDQSYWAGDSIFGAGSSGRFVSRGPVSLYANSPVIIACVTLHVNAVAQVSLEAVDGDGKAIDPQPTDLPFDIDNPAEGITQFGFLQQIVYDLLLYNHNYIYAPQKNGGPPGPLEILDPEGMQVHRSPSGAVYRTADGKAYLGEEIIHIKGSPGRTAKLYSLQDSVALSVDSRRFLRRFFVNNAFMGAIINTEIMSRGKQWAIDADTIARTFQRQFAGHNQWRVGVMGKGSTYEPVEIDVSKIISEEMRTQQETDALQAFGCSRFLVETELSHSSGLGADVVTEARRVFWQTQVVPSHKTIVERFNTDLFSDRPYDLAFNYDDVGALAIQYNEQIVWALEAFKNSGISFYEFREAMGQPVRDDVDDFFLVSTSFIPTAPDDVIQPLEVAANAEGGGAAGNAPPLGREPPPTTDGTGETEEPV